MTILLSLWFAARTSSLKDIMIFVYAHGLSPRSQKMLWFFQLQSSLAVLRSPGKSVL